MNIFPSFVSPSSNSLILIGGSFIGFNFIFPLAQHKVYLFFVFNSSSQWYAWQQQSDLYFICPIKLTLFSIWRKKVNQFMRRNDDKNYLPSLCSSNLDISNWGFLAFRERELFGVFFLYLFFLLLFEVFWFLGVLLLLLLLLIGVSSGK